MGKMINAYKILIGNLNRRDRSEYLGADGKIILECILGKRGGKLWGGGGLFRRQ
jgi:hypothetical protein